MHVSPHFSGFQLKNDESPRVLFAVAAEHGREAGARQRVSQNLGIEAATGDQKSSLRRELVLSATMSIVERDHATGG
eukprot:s2389_g9.t1